MTDDALVVDFLVICTPSVRNNDESWEIVTEKVGEVELIIIMELKVPHLASAIQQRTSQSD